MVEIRTAEQAAEIIADASIVSVSSSSGLSCPDAVLKAVGERFRRCGSPGQLTLVCPIAAGDMFGIRGVDHLTGQGQVKSIIAGSYPSGPSTGEPPLIWQLLGRNEVAAYNVPSGILFDILREGAAKRPGVMTKIGMGTFVDPDQEGCAMNDAARSSPIVRKITFEGEEWLYFPAIAPDISIIRASVADERGNLSFEHEGAYLGAMELALSARNNGGKIIAQVRHIAMAGTLKPHNVHVPGIFVDCIVEAPDQLQTTQTPHDPSISGEVFRPLQSFQVPDLNTGKVIARRAAMELEAGWTVNVGFGISANVPRILIEEGCHGDVTWVIEQGAVGGVPLLDFKFGCSSNAEAFVPSPTQFIYFQGAGFDATLLSFLQVDPRGSVNVSRLAAKPHVTAGAGGFVDITARARKIVFSGYFNAGSRLAIKEKSLVIEKEGTIPKFVEHVDQVSFSGPRAIQQGQDVTFITERCVIKLTPHGLLVTEVAPGIDLERDVLGLAQIPLHVAPDLNVMPASLFMPDPINLSL